jgi:hypothetical protein
MATDPINSFLILARLAVNVHRLSFLENEMQAYNDTFKATIDLISRIESARDRLSGSFIREFGERVDLELERTKTALKKAEEAVNWENKVGCGAQVTMRRLEWILGQNKAAIVHMDLLRQCHISLLLISTELVVIERALLPLEGYFQDARTTLLNTLARRVRRTTIVHSGADRQPPRFQHVQNEP